MLGLGLGLGLAAAGLHAEPLIDGDPAAGAKKATVCASCHGPKGNSQNPQWPKLAGQHAPYIYQQLKQFKSGTRQNPIMQGQAASLSDQDMKNLAVYFSQQTIKPGLADEKRVKQGALLYRGGKPDAGVPACSGCHGPSGLGNPTAKYPRIAGQHAAYVSKQLEAFRDGDRSGSRLAKIMTGVTAGLSDADIKALASYVSGLKPRTKQ